jgi:hypothetical protein
MRRWRVSWADWKGTEKTISHFRGRAAHNLQPRACRQGTRTCKATSAAISYLRPHCNKYIDVNVAIVESSACEDKNQLGLGSWVVVDHIHYSVPTTLPFAIHSGLQISHYLLYLNYE